MGAAFGSVVGPAAALLVGVVGFTILFLGASRDTPGLSGLPIVLMILILSMLAIGPITGALAGAISTRMENLKSALISGGVVGITLGAGVGVLLNPNVYIPATYALINSMTGISVVWILRRLEGKVPLS